MPKYLALLRGINVGGNKLVSMPKLKARFEALGFANVATYINSGNVLFEAEQGDERTIAARIGQDLLAGFGFEIPCLVITARRLQKIAGSIPLGWQNDTEQRTDVLFLFPEFDNKKSLSLIAGKPGIDNLEYVPGAIIWNIRRQDYNKSALNRFIGTPLYKNMTGRNVNTVRKLADMISKSS